MQAAEKAVKALHLRRGQEAWGHVIARLLHELPVNVPDSLIERAKVLDNFYVPTRYPNGHPGDLRSSTMRQSSLARRSTMPVRSSSSSILRWPERADVIAAVRAWIERERSRHPDLVRFGVFGSYGRGTAGVGSDLDLVAVVRTSSRRFDERGRDWRTEELPVPAEILVYTEEEWTRLVASGTRFGRTITTETRWFLDEAPAR